MSNGALRVLVVDDEPVNLMMISAQMEALGLSPWLVADAAEAVALVCDTHFDLILMDLNMPDLDGLQATAAIRRFEASHRQAAVPVVAYSSRALSAGELHANGFNGSLPKPCPAWALDNCLRQWCPGAGGAGATPPIAARRAVPRRMNGPVTPHDSTDPLPMSNVLAPSASASPDPLLRPAAPCPSSPGSRPACAVADIAADDWDVMFRAALDRLAHLADSAPVSNGDGQPPTSATALRECIDALDQLRRSVPLRGTGVSVPGEPPSSF